jgi:hypothetical protein
MLRATVFLALSALCVAQVPEGHYDRQDPKLLFGKINGQYIVVLQSEPEHTLAVQEHFTALKAAGGVVKHNYHITNEDVSKEFLGYHIVLEEGQTAPLDYIQSRIGKEVKYIEQDSEVRHHEASCTTQAGSTWGIVRTTNRNNGNDGKYTYNEEHSGEDVVTYIIDTGIETTNEDFEDRAIWGADFANDPSPGE